MAEERTTSTIVPARDESAESTSIPVKRRRRRRTAACMQCRSRKLKCDQEYPTCGRCAKGPRPKDCAYQDGSRPGHQKTGSMSPPSQPSMMALDRGATLGAAGGNGVASDSPRKSFFPEKSQVNREPIGPSGSEPNANEPEILHLPRREVQLIERVLQPSPPSKKRKTFGDQAAGVHRHSNEDGERFNRDQRPQQLEIPTKTYWRGKEGWSRFYGSSIIFNIISEFTDLKPYINEIKVENPLLMKVRQEMTALKGKERQQKLNRENTISSSTDITSLLNLLPAREIVDELVDDYLTYIESTHRILHIPTFRQEVSALWQQEPEKISQASIIQLLLILATAWGMHRDAGNPSIKEDAITCITAKDWIRQSEAWLQTNGVKRPGPNILRIRCLLIIAKEANSCRRSQAWMETGALVKLAMSAGYHREPDSQYAKISTFNREMRRRLWSTIVELDLQASLDRGMPPTVRQDDFDNVSPLNIDDEDLKETDEELSQPKPEDVATDSSFQTELARSLPLRLKICALVNAARIRISHEELLWIDSEVMQYLSDIPNWQPRHSESTANEPTQKTQHQQFTLWRTLLETKLGQSLLALHSSLVLGSSSPSFAQSSRTRLEIATMILCQQLQLISGGDNGGENKKLASLYPLTSAPLQAVLVICHHIYTMDYGYTSKIIRTHLPSIPLSLLSIVEKTLSSIESKIVLVEKGLKEYYILCMIVALVKTKISPDSAAAGVSMSATHKKEAVDRIAVLGYRILARKGAEGGGTGVGLEGEHVCSKNQEERHHHQHHHHHHHHPISPSISKPHSTNNHNHNHNPTLTQQQPHHLSKPTPQSQSTSQSIPNPNFSSNPHPSTQTAISQSQPCPPTSPSTSTSISIGIFCSWMILGLLAAPGATPWKEGVVLGLVGFTDVD